MLLRNNARRLITINGEFDEHYERPIQYDIKPGNNPPVEVPDELCDNSFVRGLIASGDLIKLSADAVQTGIDELRAKCDELGIKFDNRWGVKRLQEEIDAV